MVPGSIVYYFEREGEEPFIAVVQTIWPDDSLQLFVLHHQASANVRSARKDQCRLIMGPENVRSIQVALGSLNDKINMLLENLPAAQGYSSKPLPKANGDDPDDDEPEPEPEPDEKPWPSSSSRSTSRVRRTLSNASPTS